MALGLIQPLTEMSNEMCLGSRARPARKADNLTAVLWADRLDNVRYSTSLKLTVPYGLLLR
jgi:hypothetical protein